MKATIQLTESDLALLREQHISWEIEEFEEWQFEESSLDRVSWDWKGYAVYGVALVCGLAFWWWMAKSLIVLIWPIIRLAWR